MDRHLSVKLVICEDVCNCNTSLEVETKTREFCSQKRKERIKLL